MPYSLYAKINTILIVVIFVLLVLLAPVLTRIDQENMRKAGLVETCVVTTDVTCY
jgi:hypothetical protein